MDGWRIVDTLARVDGRSSLNHLGDISSSPICQSIRSLKREELRFAQGFLMKQQSFALLIGSSQRSRVTSLVLFFDRKREFLTSYTWPILTFAFQRYSQPSPSDHIGSNGSHMLYRKVNIQPRGRHRQEQKALSALDPQTVGQRQVIKHI